MAICLFAPGLLSAAGNQAVEILRQAIVARGQIDYSGEGAVTGYGRGPGAHAMTQTVFGKRGGKERTRLLDANGRVFLLRVSDGATVWEHYPIRGHVTRRALPSLAQRRQRDLENLSVLAANFGVELAGTETVAGRPAYRIRVVRPGPPPVLAREMWIDGKTYLELRTAHYGPDGHLVRSVMMTRVNYVPRLEANTFTFEPPLGVKPWAAPEPVFRGPLAQAERVAGFGAAPPGRVPPGFVLLKNSVSVQDHKGSRVLWMPYTNGLDAFSVFQRQAASPPPQHKGWRGVQQWVWNGYHFTLVGWLSPSQVETIRSSYR